MFKNFLVLGAMTVGACAMEFPAVEGADAVRGGGGHLLFLSFSKIARK